MFEFYEIQNWIGGESNWVQTMLGGLGGALISAWIAWYVSTRSIEAQKEIDRTSFERDKFEREQIQKSNLNKQLGHFLNLLESVIKEKLDTLEQNNKYTQALRDNPVGYHSFKIEIISDIKRALQLNSLDIRSAIEAKVSLQEAQAVYRKLYSAIDYFQMHTTRLEMVRAEMQNEWQVIAEEIKLRTNKLRADVAHIIYDIRENHVDRPKEKYFKSFDAILRGYLKDIKSNASDLNYHKEVFVDELNTLSLYDDRIYGYFIEFFSEVKDLQLRYNDLKNKGLEIADVIDKRIDIDLQPTIEKTVSLIRNNLEQTFYPSYELPDEVHTETTP